MAIALLDYQQRIVDERSELFAKLQALRKFIDSNLFETLDRREQHRLVCQEHVMMQYSDILQSRIYAFPKAGDK